MNKNPNRNGGWKLKNVLVVMMLSVAGLLAACGQPQSEEEYLQEAGEMLQQQNILKAILLYKEFLETYPESENRITAQLGLAEAYYRNREFEEFRNVMGEVSQQMGGPSTPQGFGAVRAILESYREQGMYQQAMDMLTETSATLESPPQLMSMTLLVEAGILHELMEEQEQALRMYEAILAMEPETPQAAAQQFDVLSKLAMFHEREGELDMALAMFEQYLVNHPQSSIRPQVHRDIARIYDAQENEELAQQHYDQAESFILESLEATTDTQVRVPQMLGLAEIKQLRGNTEESMEIYREVIDQHPQNPMRAFAMLQLAGGHIQTEDFESALGILQQVVTEYPNTQFAQQAMQVSQQIQQVRMRAGEIAPPTQATDGMTTEVLEMTPETELPPTADEAGGTTESAELTEPRESGIPGDVAFDEESMPDPVPAQAQEDMEVEGAGVEAGIAGEEAAEPEIGPEEVGAEAGGEGEVGETEGAPVVSQEEGVVDPEEEESLPREPTAAPGPTGAVPDVEE